MKLHPSQVKAVETRNLTLTETPEGVTAVWNPSKDTDWQISETRGNVKDAIKAVSTAQDEAYAAMTEQLEEGDEAPSYEQFLKQGQFVPETAAEAAGEGEGDEKAGGVVPVKYRNEYKARGDARGNCDGLFAYLKSAVHSVPDGKLDVAALEGIATANGLDISKYNRTSHGWEGRLRMTTGNMLRKVVKANGNKLKLPDGSEVSVELAAKAAPAAPEAAPAEA